MGSWFEFGGVRGVLGVLIGALIALIVGKTVGPYTGMPVLPAPLQGYIYGEAYYTAPIVSFTLAPTAILVSLIVAAFIAFVACGFQYWLGAKIIEWGEINIRGVWKAIAAGVIGGLVIVVVFAMLVLAGVFSVSFAAGITATLLVALIFASLPVYMIVEAGMAAITWFIYKQLGWATPE